MFKVGESLAEVTGNAETLAGVGFKASGTLGGFIIIFWISHKMILKLSDIDKIIKNEQFNLKVFLVGKPNGFERNVSYNCKFILFNERSGKKSEGNCDSRWEAGHLTINIPKVRKDELVHIKVSESTNNNNWECDYFYPRTPTAELTIIN